MKTVLKVHTPYKISPRLPEGRYEHYLMVEEVHGFAPDIMPDGTQTHITYGDPPRSVFVIETVEEIVAQLEGTEPHASKTANRLAVATQLAGSALGTALMTEVLGGRREEAERAEWDARFPSARVGQEARLHWARRVRDMADVLVEALDETSSDEARLRGFYDEVARVLAPHQRNGETIVDVVRRLGSDSEMSRWRPDEAVDGAGLPLHEHAASLAAELSPEAAESLCAELGNVLVPLQVFLRSGATEKAEKCLERPFASMKACRKQAVEPEASPRPKRGFYEILRDDEKWHRIEVVDASAASIHYIDSDGERAMCSFAQWADLVRKGEIQSEPDSVRRQRQLNVFDADPKNAHLAGERCHAGLQDGECNWKDCPQNRDNEPDTSHRHCPLDRDMEDS